MDAKNEMNTLELPESTASEIRDKINCFNCDQQEIRNAIKRLELQHSINCSHINDLFNKLKSEIFAKFRATAGGK